MNETLKAIVATLEIRLPELGVEIRQPQTLRTMRCDGVILAARFDHDSCPLVVAERDVLAVERWTRGDGHRVVVVKAAQLEVSPIEHLLSGDVGDEQLSVDIDLIHQPSPHQRRAGDPAVDLAAIQFAIHFRSCADLADMLRLPGYSFAASTAATLPLQLFSSMAVIPGD